VYPDSGESMLMRSNRLVHGYVGVVLTAAAVFTSASCGTPPDAKAAEFCAILPDSIGLYAGNPVTQMGYQIGTVKKMTPSAASVRVDFSVTDARPLPADVKAVVRSTSILADRALELVGNYKAGPKLPPGQCISLDRSTTPKSLSQVINSANTFVKSISPADSQNIGDSLRLLDQAAQNSGAGVNQILTVTSGLLDNPDQPISDLKSVVANVAALTDTLVAQRDPLKQILNDAVTTTPNLVDITKGGADIVGFPINVLIEAVADLETHAGDELQLTLDTVSDLLRINTPHTLGWISVLGGILKSLPWWINTVANHYNGLNYFPLHYRPPLYRIRTPNGAVVCNVMNFSNPGSCANVAGQPYSVDINLLQYVFMEATR
jgi:phospholipid/cholesterol/gamma-HCH transport system substrate-binding protein